MFLYVWSDHHAPALCAMKVLLTWIVVSVIKRGFLFSCQEELMLLPSNLNTNKGADNHYPYNYALKDVKYLGYDITGIVEAPVISWVHILHRSFSLNGLSWEGPTRPPPPSTTSGRMLDWWGYSFLRMWEWLTITWETQSLMHLVGWLCTVLWTYIASISVPFTSCRIILVPRWLLASNQWTCAQPFVPPRFSLK